MFQKMLYFNVNILVFLSVSHHIPQYYCLDLCLLHMLYYSMCVSFTHIFTALESEAEDEFPGKVGQ